MQFILSALEFLRTFMSLMNVWLSFFTSILSVMNSHKLQRLVLHYGLSDHLPPWLAGEHQAFKKICLSLNVIMYNSKKYLIYYAIWWVSKIDMVSPLKYWHLKKKFQSMVSTERNCFCTIMKWRNHEQNHYNSGMVYILIRIEFSCI